MARWQMLKGAEPIAAPLFDDNGVALPGDSDFSTDAVAAAVRDLGAAADGFNYVGVSADAGQD